ncbi:translation initiation factor IF-2 [Globicatella sp. HMSC072A10]|uniref:translation initiation factor IF-2 n=1 Tax=Globicatella sp. HMSC072A10 TaxID=1739315 RepID=UPI0008D6CC4D|nr:translation initiation factor IF-2 [Globicatella sp. HMSC072A10]OFK62667.1 translation initiation factor IF-2 [Globicatella sp. HMSC072A10]
MTGIRVYEFAKQNKLSSKEVLGLAKKNGIEFNSHMSMMDENQQKTLLNKLNPANTAKKTNHSQQDKKAKKPHNGKAMSEEVKMAEKKENNQPTKQTMDNSTKGKAKPRKLVEEVENDEDIPAIKKATKGAKANKDKAPVKKVKNKADDAGENKKAFEPRGRRNRRRGRNNKNNQQQTQSKGITQRKYKELPEKLVYTEGMNIQDIAKLIYRDASEIIKKLLMLGVMANQNQALSKDVIELIALEYGIEPEEKVVIDKSDLEVYFNEEEVNEEELTMRPPVVTIMGHVDHGKTTLLDQLRNSRVTEGEAGGITQHIGAYQVQLQGKTITFLDTPGHEAFTTMRARGANVTDISIIVVAADDGVMPQTVEAINHAKAADVPIIVAVNKIDKPTANPDRVMQEMTEHGLIPEDWGGDTIFVPISAKFNQNIDELLEMILLVAEVQELKANANRLAIGSVIDARLDKATGATATLLVQDGTLNVGDPIVVGNTYGKVRTMVNDTGRRIRQAGPATPVEITGLNDAPQAGDLFVVFPDEKSARQAGEERARRALEEHRDANKKVTLDNLFESLQEGELKSVNVIIKADVQGSAEALNASLQKIDVEGVRVNTIHQAVGAINESDISLAAASGAIVIGFNVRPTPQARAQAEQEQIDIRLHRIIYNVIDEIETAMKGMLEPEYVEEITGQLVVRETYTVSKLGTIAGAYVLDGYIRRNSKVRVIRDNIVIYDGELASLKRFKDDAREVTKGFECGVMIEKYNDIRVDDIIEPYHMVEVERK